MDDHRTFDERAMSFGAQSALARGGKPVGQGHTACDCPPAADIDGEVIDAKVDKLVRSLLKAKHAPIDIAQALRFAAQALWKVT